MGADPRFYPAGPPLTLAEVARLAEGALTGGDAALLIAGVAPLGEAGPEDLAFLEHRRHLPLLATTRAAAVVIGAELAPRAPAGLALIVATNPYLGFGRVARALHTAAGRPAGRHPTAIVDATARIGADVRIGAYAVIGAGAEIGEGCEIGPHAVIGEGVVLGAGCRVGTHASISHAIAGRGVVLHPGARVGQEGFGFAVTPEGRFETKPQLGRVLLGDAVEVGANACIDRGSQSDTVLGAGTRLDNLVQVGHNVRTGRGCVLVAQVGIAGSCSLGNGVQMGGQAGLSGHLTVGDGAQIAAQSGVLADVAAGMVMGGSPAWALRDWLRAFVVLRRMSKPGARPA